MNGSIVAEGDPDEIFTSAILGQTYGADLRVVRQDGLVLVADAAPHRLRDALRHRHGLIEHAHHEHPTPDDRHDGHPGDVTSGPHDHAHHQHAPHDHESIEQAPDHEHLP